MSALEECKLDVTVLILSGGRGKRLAALTAREPDKREKKPDEPVRDPVEPSAPVAEPEVKPQEPVAKSTHMRLLPIGKGR